MRSTGAFASACLWFIAIALAASAHELSEPALTPPAFGNPERVLILGYSDNAGNHNDAMEPFISRDGKYLFFNNSNGAPDTNLFWATRIDDVTFQYQGPLAGVNSTVLDAVASMDSSNNFYLITTRSYFAKGTPGYLSTIYSGGFSNGHVMGVNPVPGVSAPKLGKFDFDVEISADGNTLYYTQGVFNGGSVPASTSMKVAIRKGGKFVPHPRSTRLMAKVNNADLNYAADISASELEFFFTRTNVAQGAAAIYVATRPATSKPFGQPQKITAITGFVEAPSISPDGLSLYYHFRDNTNAFVIERVTRPQPGE
jgi:hypothetical protein